MSSELHVVFGTGPVGRNVARELVRLGQHVRSVNRSGRVDGLPAEVEVVRADVYNPQQAIEATRNAAAIYQCAQPQYYEWPAKFPALQASILNAARIHQARLIAIENLYGYGDTHGHLITEDLPLIAHTRKGRVRVAMTQELLAADRRGEVQVAIGRASNFFGPEDRAFTPQLFHAALRGEPVNALGRIDMPHTWSYVVDVGRALALLGTRAEALGHAWHIPSAPAITQTEFAALLEAELGQPVKLRPAGRVILTLIGLFNRTLREMPEMLYEWEQPFVMDSSKFTNAFQMQATPLRQAIHETLEWARRDLAASNASQTISVVAK